MKKLFTLICLAMILTACGGTETPVTDTVEEERVVVEENVEAEAINDEYEYTEEDAKLEIISLMDSMLDDTETFTSYTTSDNAYHFINSNLDMFPSQPDTYNNFVDSELEFRHVSKDIRSAGDTLMAINGTVIAIVTTPLDIPQLQNVSELEVLDDNYNYYRIIYFGELPDVYTEERINAVVLPYSMISFPNKAGGTTEGILSYAADITLE